LIFSNGLSIARIKTTSNVVSVKVTLVVKAVATLHHVFLKRIQPVWTTGDEVCEWQVCAEVLEMWWRWWL